MKPILLGLDLGSKTLGIAISDGLGLLAHPLVTLHYKNNDLESLMVPLREIVDKYQVAEFILGNPFHMNYDESVGSLRSKQFYELLKEYFDINIKLVDERLSTLISEKKLIAADVKRKKRKQIIDQMAAVEILQGELERRK